VVQIFGVSVIENEMFLVLEFCAKGSLLSWLQSDEGTAASIWLLVTMSVEMAKSILFLENKHFLHRDIAARNFLLTENLKIKLSDFGMAKASGDYNMSSKSQVPIRWSSPETLTRSIWNLATDRYSFGVTLFELFSKGGQPLALYSNEQIVQLCVREEYEKLKMMMPSKNCPQEIYGIILELTDSEPKKRPMMNEVVDKLESIQKEITKEKEKEKEKEKDKTEQQTQTEQQQKQPGDDYSRSPPNDYLRLPAENGGSKISQNQYSSFNASDSNNSTGKSNETQPTTSSTNQTTTTTTTTTTTQSANLYSTLPSLKVEEKQ